MGPETSASDDASLSRMPDLGAGLPPHTQDDDDAGPAIEIELTDLAYGGDAVGRSQGRAVFVAGGLPGELVRVQLIRERSNYARAVLLEVLRPSPERVRPAYPELGESGGFQWQHLAYPAQLIWKTRIVRQLLARIGHFPNAPVLPTIGMPATTDPWRYRTVAQFAIGPDGTIGFRRAGSHDVLDMATCPLVHPALDALYQDVRRWMVAQWGAAAPSFAERFTLRIASDASADAATSGGHVMPAGLLAIEARPGSAFDEAGGPQAVGEALLAATPPLVGVVILGLPGGRGRVVVGQDFVYDRVLGRAFRISAGSFFQVNAAQTPVLVRQAMAAANPHESDWALDGYSGVGLFALFLADHVTHVHAIESQPSAVADARASMTLNNSTNVTVTEGMLERVLGMVVRQRERVDIVLVDPPRSGCHPRALTQIRQLGPRALVYISCDPSTLARDLQLFCGEGNYRLVSVQPVDMFPFTAHVECVALCERVR
ncbi:MAG: 23S rRNA (uracil(1939)-C(5))-methyltransferase RlmD [Ktedonobacterales bacterium]|nr:23S rRNA (uracil(1939)-C(5))-methyltransferase RlmD [Ktedonobacterales bacterium]